MKTFQVNYELPDCESFQLSTTAIGRTGFGVPDPVTMTYVKQSSSQCEIFWKYNSHNEIERFRVRFLNIFYNFNYKNFDSIFQIYVKNNSNVFDQTNVVSFSQSFSIEIDLSTFEYNQKLYFLVNYFIVILKCIIFYFFQIALC